MAGLAFALDLLIHVAFLISLLAALLFSFTATVAQFQPTVMPAPRAVKGLATSILIAITLWLVMYNYN